jgi:uncharacterized membrane protein YjjB (DUF3815 family)
VECFGLSSNVLRMPAIRLMVPRLLMAQKLNNKSTNDSTRLDSTSAQTSILVFLTARAIGSLGFAVVGVLLCNQLIRQLNSLLEPSRHLVWMAFTSILDRPCTLRYFRN